jgi:ABC-type polysaccharide/polyol phosphate export permease
MTTLRGMAASLYRYRELLRNLVLKDLKLKYRGSVFGFLWSLANPLLMTVVYTVAFTFILQVRSAGFVFYLMLGLLSWTFFSSSAMMSVTVGMPKAASANAAGLSVFRNAASPISALSCRCVVSAMRSTTG